MTPTTAPATKKPRSGPRGDPAKRTASPLRVVVPYTNIHPLTQGALAELAPDAERVFVGRTEYDYAHLLERLWRERETFLIVEHDVQLTADALREAVECECLWSASPYEGQGDRIRELNATIQSLGCVRFRAELMEKVPNAAVRANTGAGTWASQAHWRNLDGRILWALGTEGFRPHQHVEVPHHH